MLNIHCSKQKPPWADGGELCVSVKWPIEYRLCAWCVLCSFMHVLKDRLLYESIMIEYVQRSSGQSC